MLFGLAKIDSHHDGGLFLRYMRLIVLSIIYFLLLGAIFYGGAFARSIDTAFGLVQSAFAAPYLLLKSVWLRQNIARELSSLALENQSLRAELFSLKEDFPHSSTSLIAAKVYALYPFNNKSVLTLAAGKNFGIREGAAVLAAPNIILGKIVKVGDDWSEVRTVFDATYDIPVRIGSSGTSGLLKGGAALTVTLIAKGKQVAVGEAVYAVSKELPYGLIIGNVAEINEHPGEAFFDAVLAVPYVMNDLTTVFVMP